MSSSFQIGKIFYEKITLFSINDLFSTKQILKNIKNIFLKIIFSKPLRLCISPFQWQDTSLIFTYNSSIKLVLLSYYSCYVFITKNENVSCNFRVQIFQKSLHAKTYIILFEPGALGPQQYHVTNYKKELNCPLADILGQSHQQSNSNEIYAAKKIESKIEIKPFVFCLFDCFFFFFYGFTVVLSMINACLC